MENISLEVKESEYVVILGPTGSGKTTLLRTVAGLARQDSGRIFFDGRPVEQLAPFDRGVAYLPQNYSLFGHMTVWDNVAFGPTVQDWEIRRRDQIVREMLNLVHLSDRRDAFPRELSGGMQQRAALARALATQAQILLLDEPLRALDARLRIELRQELRVLAKDLGITTLHVTHDQEEAVSIADRIAVLRRGKVVQVGSPEEIYETHQDPFVANFVGEANFFEGVLRKPGPGNSVVELPTRKEVIGRTADIAQGSAVVLGVKTDRCDLRPNRLEGENCFPGTVARTLFLGKRISVEVDTNSGVLKAKVPSDRSQFASEGAEVTVQFQPDHAIVYPVPAGGLQSALEVE